MAKPNPSRSPSLHHPSSLSKFLETAKIGAPFYILPLHCPSSWRQQRLEPQSTSSLFIFQVPGDSKDWSPSLHHPSSLSKFLETAKIGAPVHILSLHCPSSWRQQRLEPQYTSSLITVSKFPVTAKIGAPVYIIPLHCTSSWRQQRLEPQSTSSLFIIPKFPRQQRLEP